MKPTAAWVASIYASCIDLSSSSGKIAVSAEALNSVEIDSSSGDVEL